MCTESLAEVKLPTFQVRVSVQLPEVSAAGDVIQIEDVVSALSGMHHQPLSKHVLAIDLGLAADAVRIVEISELVPLAKGG